MAVATLLLLHGAGSGPSVFDGWARSFRGIHVEAVDLQQGLDPSRASMADYVRNVVDTAERLEGGVALLGWSMGGLVAMMAARQLDVEALVLLEPSAPAEIQGFSPDVPQRQGTFDPEEVYGGAFPASWGARPESLPARDERKRGISIPALPERTLVVYGRDFGDERGRALAMYYGIEEHAFAAMDHGDLVTREDVRKVVAQFVLRSS